MRDRPIQSVVVTHIDFESLVEALPDSVLVVDDALTLTFASHALHDMLGWVPGEWVGRCMLDLVHPDDAPIVESVALVAHNKPMGSPIEVRLRRSDGAWRWIEMVGRDVVRSDGEMALVLSARDITQRRIWEVAAVDNAIFHHLVQHGSSIMMLLDDDGRISSVNAAFSRLLGHDSSRTVGRPLTDFCEPGSAPALEAAFDSVRGSGKGTACEVAMRSADAKAAARPIRFEVVNLLDDPVVAGFVLTGHDITDLHRVRKSLEHLATHDALTGLANRSVLITRLEQLLADELPVAAVFIDLDRFKPVNDLFGHETGDELLCQVADRLRRVVGPDDLVARVGGDEFVALAVGMRSGQDTRLYCERIDEALAEPYLLSNGSVRITASVGAALADAESTVTGLLADADMLMYESKAARRGEPVGRDTRLPASANDRRRLADELAAGLRRGEVVAYLQPIVEVETGRTVAVEALARWHHPTLGTLQPKKFLDLADDAGLDLLLGDAVLRSACEAVAGLHRPISLGVNLSVTQLADRGLSERVGVILQQNGLTPDRLMVEITERDPLSRRASSGRAAPERTLMELREMGASLSLDDFGTGYSSLAHIRQYPLRALKIDRMFVEGMPTRLEDRAVVAAVLAMGSTLGLRVVAEGVETADEYRALRDMGCEMVQGFLICEPLTADELPQWLTTRGDDWRRPTVDRSARAFSGTPLVD